MKTMMIGKVAKSAGIGVETVRFYERRGLIESPPRNESGYRQYPVSTIHRLRFIRRAKELGFSLREIKELLELQTDPASTCGDIMKHTEQKLADINRKIDDLIKIRDALNILFEACSRDRTLADCPIINAMSDKESQH